jgi:hypothetical protein
MLGTDDIARVAWALGNLKDRCLLTGGASIPFYCIERHDEAPRPTRDVDVVLQVRTHSEYQEIETLLRQRGFRHDVSAGAPICRWVVDGSILVDVMPLDGAVLGFTNPWYAAGWDHAIPVRISADCDWRMLSAPFALAAKCVAFLHRGARDPQSSHDLEDIIRLIDGRPPLPQEVAAAPATCRHFVAGWVRDLLQLADLPFVLSGHLNGDRSSQARIPLIRQRLLWLADPSQVPGVADHA